jgi:hypothetical protein
MTRDPHQVLLGLALDQATEDWMVPHLSRCYRLWQHANREWFGGQLSTPLIRIELPHRGLERQTFADIGPTDQAGASLEVRIHPELVRGRDPDWHRPADRDLLHEMCHAHQLEALGWPWDPDLDWHGRTFVRKLVEVELAYALDLTIARRITR